MKERKFAGEDVKNAVIAAGIQHIPHHDCCICGEWVSYGVHDGALYFNSACGCSYAPPRLEPWEKAADWINMQTNEAVRNKIAAKFGLKVDEAIP